MDLSKVKDDEKLNLCRWYFRGGFAFLPFLWAINFIWFFKDAFIRDAFDEQKDIRKYILCSGIGAFIWIVALISWIAVFQTNRIAWGEFADDLSFVIPTGSA